MNIDLRFLVHNSHLENAALFQELDPQLRSLKRQTYVFESTLLKQLPNVPGIYTLSGGRQIGKSTLLKQWMLNLLKAGVKPQSIFFLSGELIDDHHALFKILLDQLALMSIDNTRYLIVDEITYIKDWDKAIKYAADAGYLENVILMLTGSDLTLIQEARMRFPGRRGEAALINFHLYSLSFKEVVFLKRKVPDLELMQEKLKWKLENQSLSEYQPTKEQMSALFLEYNDYLKHGGFLTAINDHAKHNSISVATLTTYSEWIRGDVLKRNRQERYLREILISIVKRYNSQVSWNALAQDLSIDHPKTVAEYVELLESMDALFIQHALLEDKLSAAPKKGKKLIFTDPFIFHAVRSWIYPDNNPYQNQVMTSLADPILCSQLVEACVSSHYRRFYPTYYIKAEGEVDVAYIDQQKFWPVEVKWTNQLRNKDLKQILKYRNARIFSKNHQFSKLEHILIEPLPFALLKMNQEFQ